MGRSKPPAFQLYAADLLTDVMDWTDEEVGVHVRLLCWSWVNRRGIPRDYPRMTRISAAAEKAWPVVGSKWTEGPDDTWINERLEETRKASDAFRIKQKEKSERAVAARMGSPKASPAGTSTGSPVDHPLEDEEEERVLVSEKNSKERYRKEQARNLGFADFYASYPNKKARGAAERAWIKIRPEERPLCKPAIEAQIKANHFRGADGNDYIPHPATWLNGRRWEDEVKQAPVPMVNGAPRELTKAEAFARLAEIRVQLGRAPGAPVLAEEMPPDVRKVLMRG